MNTLVSPKLAGFVRGLAYPIIMVVLAYVIQNLGASGIFPVGVATLITSVLGIIDHALQAQGNGAVFGLVK